MHTFVFILVALVSLLDNIGSYSIPVVQRDPSSQNESSYAVPCERNEDCPNMLPICREVIQPPVTMVMIIGNTAGQEEDKPDKRCVCELPGYQFNSTSNACEPGIGGKCLTSKDDCINSTICRGSSLRPFDPSYCSCLPGFYWKKHEGCILDPDQCLTDADCIGPNVKCEFADNCHIRRKCECDDGFQFTRNNQCTPFERCDPDCTLEDQVCCGDKGNVSCKIPSACNESVYFIVPSVFHSAC